jgi:hypothetical protein
MLEFVSKVNDKNVSLNATRSCTQLEGLNYYSYLVHCTYTELGNISDKRCIQKYSMS